MVIVKHKRSGSKIVPKNAKQIIMCFPSMPRWTRTYGNRIGNTLEFSGRDQNTMHTYTHKKNIILIVIVGILEFSFENPCQEC